MEEINYMHNKDLCILHFYIAKGECMIVQRFYTNGKFCKS